MKRIFSLFLAILISATPSFAAHNYEILTARTVISDTSTYDAFGDMVKIDDDTVLHVYRQGTAHGTGTSTLVGEKYTISTGTWGAKYEVLGLSAGHQYKDVEMGIIQNRIILFFKRENTSGDTLSLEYMFSTDLTGTSWGTPTALTPHAAFTSFLTKQGGFSETNIPGRYILLAYHLTGSTRSIRVFVSTDYGVTWADNGVPIVSSTTQWGEPTVCHIGDGKMIGLVRRNDGGWLGYFTSADNGATWTGISNATNLPNSTSVKPATIYYDEQYDYVFVSYLSRGGTTDDILYYTVSSNPQLAYSSFTNAFPTPLVLTSDGFNNGFNGYTSQVRIDHYRYLIVWSEQVSSSDADIYHAIVRVGDEGMTFR